MIVYPVRNLFSHASLIIRSKEFHQEHAWPLSSAGCPLPTAPMRCEPWFSPHLISQDYASITTTRHVFRSPQVDSSRGGDRWHVLRPTSNHQIFRSPICLSNQAASFHLHRWPLSSPNQKSEVALLALPLYQRRLFLDCRQRNRSPIRQGQGQFHACLAALSSASLGKTEEATPVLLYIRDYVSVSRWPKID